MFLSISSALTLPASFLQFTCSLDYSKETTSNSKNSIKHSHTQFLVPNSLSITMTPKYQFISIRDSKMFTLAKETKAFSSSSSTRTVFLAASWRIGSSYYTTKAYKLKGNSYKIP